MGLRIQNNVEAFNTHRQLTATGVAASKSMEKLSSGYRINRAADDAAGLAISEKMRGQIGGLAQAQRNAQDGISLVQTAEGALDEVHSMLQRVRDLKVQYDNGTLSDDDKDAIVSEVVEIAKEVKSIQSTTTKFNGKALFGARHLHVPGRRQRRARRSPRPRPTSSANIAGGGLSELADLATAGAASTALRHGGRPRHAVEHRHGDQERLHRARQLRRGPEPSRAPSGEPGDLPGEPDGVRVADPRRGHGG